MEDTKIEKENCICDETCACHEGEDCVNPDCNCTNRDEEACHCNDQCKCDDGCECHEENPKKKKEKKHKKEEKYEEMIEKLLHLNKELEEKALRETAELVNYRKRKDEEVVRMLKYANEDLVKELLVTLDNFERAISLDDENLNDELSKFLSGFKMIYCNMKGVLEKYEVKAIDGNNKPFDPTYHQAVMTAQVEGMEPGMVIEVLQKGYLYKDRVIRPAMVRVSE